MTWCLYFLTKHPEVQEKVYQEIEEVLGDEDIKPMVSSELKSVTYLFWSSTFNSCFSGIPLYIWPLWFVLTKWSYIFSYGNIWIWLKATLWKFIPMGLKHEYNKYIDRTDKFFNIIICQNKKTKGLKSRVVQKWFDYKRQNLAVTGQN